MKIAAIFLSAFLLFKPLLPLVEYAAFYDYIKNELCENKEDVEMQCNGKCYLKKQLAKAADTQNDDEKSPSILIENTFVYFQEVANNCIFTILKEENPKLHTMYNNRYTFDFIPSIFHPPAA